ncbi:hypothetical protein OQA88_9118 [Cercophora sp. LCS_1]
MAILALARHGLSHGDDETNMAPLGFMWPPERTWSAESGMTAPCGSANRAAKEPGGSLALDGKQEVFDVRVSISFSEDPENNDDFKTVLSGVDSLDFEHVCIPMPALQAGEGKNATLQLRYVAEWIDPHHSHKRHTETNQTFYSCADVTFVEAAKFTFEIPCFNATAEEHGDDEGAHGHGEDGHDHDHEEEHHEDGSDGLSKEAIAGIAIGCVAAFAAVSTLMVYLFRRDRREKLLVRSMTEDVKL